MLTEVDNRINSGTVDGSNSRETESFLLRIVVHPWGERVLISRRWRPLASYWHRFVVMVQMYSSSRASTRFCDDAWTIWFVTIDCIYLPADRRHDR